MKVHWAFHDNSTPNIIRHARGCKAAVSKDDDEPKLVQYNLTSFVQGSTYTATCLHVKHVRMSARHHVPHAFVKWEEYCSILHMFNKDMKYFQLTLSHGTSRMFITLSNSVLQSSCKVWETISMSLKIAGLHLRSSRSSVLWLFR